MTYQRHVGRSRTRTATAGTNRRGTSSDVILRVMVLCVAAWLLGGCGGEGGDSPPSDQVTIEGRCEEAAASPCGAGTEVRAYQCETPECEAVIGGPQPVDPVTGEWAIVFDRSVFTHAIQTDGIEYRASLRGSNVGQLRRYSKSPGPFGGGAGTLADQGSAFLINQSSEAAARILRRKENFQASTAQEIEDFNDLVSQETSSLPTFPDGTSIFGCAEPEVSQSVNALTESALFDSQVRAALSLDAPSCVSVCDCPSDQGLDCVDGQCVAGDSRVYCCSDPCPESEQCRDAAGVSRQCSARDCAVTTTQCGNGIIESGEQCDDGNLFFGDGCSELCTIERTGTCRLSSGLNVTLQTGVFAIPVALSGQVSLSVAGAGPVRDLRLNARETRLDPARVPGLVCLCVLLEQAVGQFGCGLEGLGATDYIATRDHNTNDVDPACSDGTADDIHSGVCNGPAIVDFTGTGPRGSMHMTLVGQLGILMDGGRCVESGPGTGPDGHPCTADDEGLRIPFSVEVTTGDAQSRLIDVNNSQGITIEPGVFCGASDCIARLQGTPGNCDPVDTSLSEAFDGMRLVGTAPLLDLQFMGDVVLGLSLDCVSPLRASPSAMGEGG